MNRMSKCYSYVEWRNHLSVFKYPNILFRHNSGHKKYRGGAVTTGNAFDDDFERADSEDGSFGLNPNGINLGGNTNNYSPTTQSNHQGKQKEFVIKKMFKVPSNEQMSSAAQGFAVPIVPPGSNTSSGGPPSAKGAGINILNVNPAGAL